MENICATCGKENVPNRCSLCHKFYYCDQKCQGKHWKTHKWTCEGYHPPRSADDFQFLEILGIGNFSEIIHVEERRTGKQYALKKVNKQKVTQLRKQADILMEKHVMNRLKDLEGVVHLYECFKDSMDLYFLYERVEGGEIWDRCKIFGMPEIQMRYFLRQFLETMKEVHARGIVHRDIKTENVLITNEGKIKIIDFGTAKDLEHPEVEVPGNSMRKKKFENFVGTPHFMAPECIKNKDSSFKSDMWSIGCMAYYMLAGYPPFQGGSDYLIFTKALELNYSFPSHFSENAISFIQGIIKLIPEERPSVDDLLKHQFISEAPTKYPIASLRDIALETIKDDLTKKFTHDNYEEGLKNTFDKFWEKLGRVDTRLQELYDRLKHFFSREGAPPNQGV
ncbi:unnamed protein product [Blepharisma stoltei]|uniref:Protein kinase domain-containing protein n=1 Tax=Blepharisma stoltei TaxID=1481888 RepID=A0AAU9IP73_9CILI|nr:unnamed protein product [Blepharisma stoltei]